VDDWLTLAAKTRAEAPIDVLVTLTLLSLAPFVLVMCTSFVRIAVVLSLVRSALGASAVPPNAALAGLSLVLTMVVMAQVLREAQRNAIGPYARGRITQAHALERAGMPLRAFMVRQTHAADVTLFERFAGRSSDAPRDAPWTVLLAAFAVGELRSGFAIGFALYLPFVAIDLAVASILMGLGMVMLSPPIVSLPLKLLLFVMVDGWALICGGVAASFR
jgi:flagellar biosynthesis protein FliP